MRIIGGTHRGRKLHAPKGQTTRPTLDRVREALFSILGDVQGARVLDCYAGTGAMGMEAASRGAETVILVEADRGAHRVLSDNIRTLTLEAICHPWLLRVEALPPRLSSQAPFDLLLADPPWPIAQPAATLMASTLVHFMATDARVVLGHPKRLALTLPANCGLVLDECRTWGDSALSFYRLDPSEAPAGRQ